jgi:hypothetical protein
MKSDHVYYTLKIFENFMFLEDENVPLVLGGLSVQKNISDGVRSRNESIDTPLYPPFVFGWTISLRGLVHFDGMAPPPEIKVVWFGCSYHLFRGQGRPSVAPEFRYSTLSFNNPYKISVK